MKVVKKTIEKKNYTSTSSFEENWVPYVVMLVCYLSKEVHNSNLKVFLHFKCLGLSVKWQPMTRISNHCLGELFRNMTFLKLNKNWTKSKLKWHQTNLPAFETTGGLPW